MAIDFTYIKENGGKVLSREDNKVYQFSNISNTWVEVGIVNGQIVTAQSGMIGLISTYDSTFDNLEGAITPDINLTNADSDGNIITWTGTTGTLPNPIVTISGTSPSFSLVPRKTIGDTLLSSVCTFTGVINPTGVDSAPHFAAYNLPITPDSGFTADSLGMTNDGLTKLEMSYSYTWESVILTEFNHEKAISLNSFSVPPIQYLSIKNSNLSTSRFTDLQFKPGGLIIFLLDKEQDKILSYSLTTAYNINTIDYTTEKSKSLNSSNLPFAEPSAMDFNSNGSKLYIVDRVQNQIVEYTLVTPYDISTMSRKDNFLQHTTKLISIEDGFISPDGKYYYTLEVPSIRILKPSESGKSWAEGMQKEVNAGKITRYTLNDLGNISTLTTDSSGNPEYEMGFRAERFSNPISSPWMVSGPHPIEANWKGGGERLIPPGDSIGVHSWEHFGLPQALCFNDSGTKMYIAEAPSITNGRIRQLDLATAWNPYTANDSSFVLHKFGSMMTNKIEDPSILYGQTWVGPATGQNGDYEYASRRLHSIASMKISSDGTKLYLLDRTTQGIYQFNLSAAYSLNSITDTIVPLSKLFDDGGYDIKVNLTTLDSASSRINQDLSTLNSINISDSGHMFVSGDKYIHTIELNSGNLVSNLIRSSVNNSMNTGNSISGVLARNNKLYVHSDSGIINQWKMNTVGNTDTTVREFASKFATLTGSIGANGLVLDSDNSKLYIGGDSVNIIQRYSFNSNTGFTSLIFDSNFSTDSIGGISGMSFADSNSRLHVTSGNKISQITIDSDLFQNSVINQENYTIGAPLSDSAIGIAWHSGGSRFTIIGTNSTSNALETFTTQNNYSVKSI